MASNHIVWEGKKTERLKILVFKHYPNSCTYAYKGTMLFMIVCSMWMYLKGPLSLLLLCQLKIFETASGRCRKGLATWFMSPASGMSGVGAFSPQ